MDKKQLKAISSQKRLDILGHLGDRELSAGQIRELMNISQPLCSLHLLILKDANFVKTRKEGTVIWYSVSDEKIMNVVYMIEEWN